MRPKTKKETQQKITKNWSDSWNAATKFFQKCVINKDQLKLQKLKQAKLVVFAGPTANFKEEDIAVIDQYVEQGGNVVFLSQDGGDRTSRSNLNSVLAKYSMAVANNSIIRTTYFKYFHPKEALITNGVLHKDFLRLVNNEEKDQLLATLNQNIQNDERDTIENQTYQGFKFVYPFGTSIIVKSPAVPILSTGSVCFPVNSYVFSYIQKGSGKVFLLGSWQLFSDIYFDSEENSKIFDFILKLIKKDKSVRPFQPEKDIVIENGNSKTSVPNIEALSEKLKSCVQESPDISHNFLSQFKHNLFEANFNHLPEALDLYKKMSIPYAPLKLISPIFETPMLGLTPSVFPPILVDLEPPKLELFDLDDEFANQE